MTSWMKILSKFSTNRKYIITKPVTISARSGESKIILISLSRTWSACYSLMRMLAILAARVLLSRSLLYNFTMKWKWTQKDSITFKGAIRRRWVFLPLWTARCASAQEFTYISSTNEPSIGPVIFSSWNIRCLAVKRTFRPRVTLEPYQQANTGRELDLRLECHKNEVFHFPAYAGRHDRIFALNVIKTKMHTSWQLSQPARIWIGNIHE